MGRAGPTLHRSSSGAGQRARPAGGSSPSNARPTWLLTSLNKVVVIISFVYIYDTKI